MRAWSVVRPGPAEGSEEASLRFAFVEKPMPVPADDELLVRVTSRGVCRTGLHVVEGELPVRRAGVTPGHEVVGAVARATGGFAVGDRVGVAWPRRTDGTRPYCLRGAENLCPASRYTGWDADGGYAEYAEYATVPAAFAHRLPDGLDDVPAAPLLCAGIIGHRALRRAALPPGGRLGLYGFGGSAHLCARIALSEGATVHVLTRGQAARRPALDLGATSAQDAYAPPPEPLDSAILFAPVGVLVPVALRALDRGGTPAVAGIQKQVRSVTSNTPEDAREFLALAAR
ncbi:zinc-binding alcohol dehydrogenase family protein [Streptomyces sp. NPDC002817]|uniref:zinc-binding alcohol dehydrogenase family protein n=1 Tax=Streptomyces sp. NPDC088357 TaxID=3154655 RepID=UPI0034361A7E